jgi:hypothetical protein
MSNIDFTKPVETIDGTPVQIISTKGRGKYPILGYIGNKSQYVTSWMPDGFYLSDKSESGLNLRNKDTQPQEPWAAEKAAFAAGETIQYKHPFMLEWRDFTGLKAAFERDLGIIWRIKPKPQKVPLEPCDVPPGSVIRGAAWQGKWSQCYIFVLEVTPDGVFASRGWEIYTWKALSESWQIKRPTDTEWQPCWKEI